MKERSAVPWQRIWLAVAAALGLAVLQASAAQAADRSALKLTGEGPDDDFGWSVSAAGDVNGDGVPDLFVGAPSNDAVAGFAGRAYLFNGPFKSPRNAADADAIISAEDFGDNLGISVSSAGDTNGDGRDDLLIGARGNDDAGIQAGRVYLFRGPVSGHLQALQADAVISGDPFEELGRAVASVGDINGHGLSDVVLGAPLAGAGFEGRAYVFIGPLQGSRPSSSADAIISGVLFNESLGSSVASAGDINGDGIADLVVGAPRPPLNGEAPGRAYVFFGPVFGPISAAQADVVIEGEGLSDEFGTSVASAGDVNGDGLPDLIVGAEQIFVSGTGKAYVFYGPLSGSLSAADADAILLGEAPKDVFGVSVSSAGDVNGDGFGDVVVGAWDAGAGGIRSGRAYVFFGPLSGTISAAKADLFIDGIAGDEVGQSVATARDLNADGLGDVIVGAPQFRDGDPGYARIVFGQHAVLDVEVTPKDEPLEVPPEGGPVRFEVAVASDAGFSRSFDAWIEISNQDEDVRLLRGPFHITLGPGDSARRRLTELVPGSAPAGTYTVKGSVGRFPAAADSDAFTFVKLGALP